MLLRRYVEVFALLEWHVGSGFQLFDVLFLDPLSRIRPHAQTKKEAPSEALTR